MTTQTATDRKTARRSRVLQRAVYLSACFGMVSQPFFLSGNLRFHLDDHLCQLFFTFLFTVSVSVSRMLFAVRPDRGVSALPQMVIDLSDASGPRLTPLTFVSLEGDLFSLPQSGASRR